MNDKAAIKASVERSLDEALLGEVLGERQVQKDIVARYYKDFDRIMSEGTGERPWQSFELTQRENVFEWIEDPSRIAKIQPSLRDLRQLVRSQALHCEPNPVTVLDVGCYGGYVFDYLKRYAFRSEKDFYYTGVDIDPNVVRAASYVHSDEPNAQFEKADIYALSEQYGEGSFDVVLCSRVLIHIPRFRDAISELFKVARRAVVLVLEIAESPVLERIHRKNLDNGVELDYFFRKYAAEELSSVAEELGADFRLIMGPSFYSTVLFFKEDGV